ncbi:MAG: ABC transporter substrate-binding protein [Bacteroidota bacterium]
MDKQVFRMNLSETLNSLDPAFASARTKIWMTSQLFNGLVSLDSQLNIQPSIARSYEISEDRKTYTFQLKKGVYFHKDPLFGPDSSRSVTAHDFVYSFNRICDPDLGSSGFWIFRDKIPGIEAFRSGESKQISGFRALNDSVFQVSLSRPFPAFISLLAMPFAFVVPKEIVDHYGDDFSSHPIGTGPFRFYRWQEGQSLILHKNPAYFEQDETGQALPYLDAVEVSFMSSRLSAFIEFIQDKLDFIGDLDNSYKDEVLYPDGRIKEDYQRNYQVILAPQLNIEFLCFQMDEEAEVSKGHPIRDVRIRKAINHAIDKEKLVKYLLNGMGYPAHAGIVPQGMPGFNADLSAYPYDLQKARDLLKEAGYPQGKGLPELVLNSTAKYAAISEFVQKSCEHIGIKINVQNMEGGALRTESKASKLNFWRASWIADYPDPENYLGLLYGSNFSPDGPNRTHYKDERFDQLYNKSLSIRKDSLRFIVYQKMDSLAMADAPIVPLYYDKSFRILQKGISGMVSNPMNHLFLKRVRKTSP